MLRLLAAALALAAPLCAHAADQLILGNQLQVKNPSTPEKRKVVAKAKEVGSADAIVGNPTSGGATLQIRANGDNPSSQTYTLPSGISGITGKPFWSGDAVKGYKYKDSKGENGPVKVAQIKKSGSGTFQIKAVITGKFQPVTVLPPDDGTDGCVLLTLAGGDSYSVLFADGIITNKGPKEFKVKKPTQLGTCVTTTTSTTTTTSSSTTTTTLNGLCSNGTLDAGEQCDPPGSSCGAGGGTCALSRTCTCDFLDPSECMYPFPNDWFTLPDGTKDTGKRVNFNNLGMPRNATNIPIESSDYNRNDGFSVGPTILTHVPSIDLAMTGAALSSLPISRVARAKSSSPIRRPGWSFTGSRCAARSAPAVRSRSLRMRRPTPISPLARAPARSAPTPAASRARSIARQP